MTTPTTPDLTGLAGDVLALLGDGDGVDAQVQVRRTRLGLTRFANSFVHQHVDEDTTIVDVRVSVDGRVAGASTTDLEPASVREFAARVLETARAAPVDPGFPGFAPADEELPALDHFDAATAENDPGARAELVSTFVGAAGDLRAAGYCDTEAVEAAHVNRAGQVAFGRMTRATLDGIHQTASSAGAGHTTDVALAGLDVDTAASRARRHAERGRDPEDVEPGSWDVVLGPEATATLLVFLGFYGFNAKAHGEGQSAIRLGEQQLDASVTLRDAAEDPRVIALPFDAEGTGRTGLTLVDSGVSNALLHDRRTAKRAGTTSTGNAVGDGSWGAFPTTVVLTPGAATPHDLVAGVERGLYIAAFNYCRILDPKTLVVTGLTRNGTFLVEDGRMTGGVANLRFTQSFLGALGPGNVLGIGNDDRYADGEFGPAMAIAPTVRLGAFNITGGARG